MKKILLVVRAALQNTVSDKKNIILFLIIGFILDNGVRCMVENAMQVQQPIGVFEGFIMCLNHWYYLVIFLVGFIFLTTDIPRLNSEQILLIYRSGKKNWLIGELLQIAICAVVYICLLLISSVISCGRYGYIGNVWSNFTVYYQLDYKNVLSDNNRFIDQQVFKYYSPYQSVIHGFMLLFLCLVLMGTIVLLFSIIQKKLVGIVLNLVLILSVLIFNNYHMWEMWLSPFCHVVLALHNIYVYRQLSVPLEYSYLYIGVMEIVLIILSMKCLQKKMFC